MQLGHNYIGTEHILLGMLREGDGVAAQVLVRLGADLNRVRQQVIQLVHGYQGQDVESAGPRPGGRAPAGLPGDALAGFDALDRRLTALERWVSMQPDLEDLDQEIAQVRRDKQAAAARQDSGAATALRDKEKQLLADRADREKEWAGSAAGRQDGGQGTGPAEYRTGKAAGGLARARHRAGRSRIGAHAIDIGLTAHDPG